MCTVWQLNNSKLMFQHRPKCNLVCMKFWKQKTEPWKVVMLAHLLDQLQSFGIVMKLPFKSVFPFQSVQHLHSKPLFYSRYRWTLISQQVRHNVSKGHLHVIVWACWLHAQQLISKCYGDVATAEQISVKSSPLQRSPVPEESNDYRLFLLRMSYRWS